MKYRAPLEPGERVITCNRAHPAKLLRPALVLLAGIFLASFLQTLSGQYPAWAPVAPLLLVAALLFAAAKTYRWLVTGYALTDRRVVIFRSLRGRKPLAIPLEQTTGITGPPGPLHRLTGTGTVRIAIPGQVFDLTYQKEPERFVGICQECRDRRFIGRSWPMPRV